MSDPVIRVPQKLRRESQQFAAYRALKRRFPTLTLTIYGSGGVLEQIVVQERGKPRVLAVEDAPEQGEDSP